MSAPVEAEVVWERGAAGGDDPALVTVAVSAFNYAHHLPECLHSLAAQTHGPLELIVVDDRSTDDTLAVARDWMEAAAARFSRVVLLRHAQNQGLAVSRNTAFARASGRQVMVMDADNALYPRAIARLLEALEGTGAALAYSQIAMFGDNTGPGYADGWAPERFRRANYVDAMALVSRAAWVQVGGYHHLEHGWEDFDFWCRFVEAGLDGVFVPEMLCRYRVHGASMLRQDTDRRRAEVIAELSLRHPWLDLHD